jgi:transcriptional regulator with XRE-family HTH domain
MLSETLQKGLSRYRIGEKLRALRLKKSMGLVELGRHTGLSPALISKLERGKLIPTLPTLLRIALVFGKDLPFFFEQERQTLFRIHRQAERIRLPQEGVGDPAYYFESLGYEVNDRQLDPYWAEFVPQKGKPHLKQHTHPGCEFIYMVEGELELKYRNDIERLEAGDAVYFDSTVPHSYRCLSTKKARAVVVTSERTAPTLQQLRAHSTPANAL